MDWEDIIRKIGYVPIRKLGEGGFGCVFQCYHPDTQTIFAVKVVQSDKFDQREVDTSFDLSKDIKLDNILLHSPPGTGRVQVKISDFGFAKKAEYTNEQTYLAGTIPYMV
ncbi:MAG: hypothetical protein EZS28_037962 [Streblomastix strix]|uniref:Protein kinase domain-containing protein n=1 Tax=Streblomastix strix TaxID=222440 RepID=A0A5J4U9E8_9EUKA|nr:MAG: hypothetical protein EZS28_037962 [Streblomastix strix]